jgi:hypothetical protein
VALYLQLKTTLSEKCLHKISFQDHRQFFFLSQPEKGATFLLCQFVIDCDMLYAMFFDFWNCLKISQNATFGTSLAFQMSMPDRLENVNFSPNLSSGPTYTKKCATCIINFFLGCLWKGIAHISHLVTFIESLAFYCPLQECFQSSNKKLSFQYNFLWKSQAINYTGCTFFYIGPKR